MRACVDSKGEDHVGTAAGRKGEGEPVRIGVSADGDQLHAATVVGTRRGQVPHRRKPVAAIRKSPLIQASNVSAELFRTTTVSSTTATPSRRPVHTSMTSTSMPSV